MKIIGLDVGRGSAVLCCLSEFPANIQQHYKMMRREKLFWKVNCDRAGVERLLSLSPNALVLEPSGHWYAQFWVAVAKHYQISIYWVSHTDLYNARGLYGFVNKRDEEDALTLAGTYFDKLFIDAQGNKRYLNYYQNEIVANLRELFLAKEQLQKLRTNLIAQLRQRLSYEFPEAAIATLHISLVRGYTPLIYWLATGIKNNRYDNKYRLSIAHELEISISDYTRQHAQLIIDIEQRYIEHLDLLKQAVDQPQFKEYNQVFNLFNFGLSCRSLLLYNIYPFDKFLVGGKPLIDREVNQQGKIQKRDRSLRKFQAFLGMSFSYKASGNKKSRKFHGSSLIRSHLYAWAVCTVAPQGYRNDTSVGKQLSDRYQELRVNVKGKDALIRVLFKATRLLYFELQSKLVR
jgi:hypothetical protein